MKMSEKSLLSFLKIILHIQLKMFSFQYLKHVTPLSSHLLVCNEKPAVLSLIPLYGLSFLPLAAPKIYPSLHILSSFVLFFMFLLLVFC